MSTETLFVYARKPNIQRIRPDGNKSKGTTERNRIVGFDLDKKCDEHNGIVYLLNALPFVPEEPYDIVGSNLCPRSKL
jgi:hypothetical protein